MCDPWTHQDIMLEITWQALHIVDMGTTLNITDHPDRYWEINPILGRHPSREAVYAYMTASAILHPIIAHYLPVKTVWLGFRFNPRRIWQATTWYISAWNVQNNLSIGLEMRF